MNETATSSGDLFINGALLPALWPHSHAAEQPLCCPGGRETLAASRWKVRTDSAPITLHRSAAVPPGSALACSVELRSEANAVPGTVFFGQRIEAAEAFRYRQALLFTAWIFVEGRGEAEVELHAAAPIIADHFAGELRQVCREGIAISRGVWTRVALPLDGRDFPSTGLRVELALTAGLFTGAVRIAQLSLVPAAAREAVARPIAVETMLAERFFQRHNSARINSLGRALVVNAHELHFQFTFPEMRAFPACTLPHSEEGLRVFHLEGIPQSGFRYDVTYRSRSSVIIRVTKENHGLADGFLSFVGNSAAIILDAEL